MNKLTTLILLIITMGLAGSLFCLLKIKEKRYALLPTSEGGSVVSSIGTTPTNPDNFHPSVEQARISLITGLRENSQMIYIGPGFFYLNSEDESAMNSILSYMHENTNFSPCIIFSVRSNCKNGWVWGHLGIDISQVAKDLGLTNGTFVGFVSK